MRHVRRGTLLPLRGAIGVQLKAWCKICSSDWERFEAAYDTCNSGLGIETRSGESGHFGSPLFNRGAYAIHELHGLAERHPNEAIVHACLSSSRLSQ